MVYYTYDERNNVSVAAPEHGPAAYYSYDAAGNTVKVVRPGAAVTYFAYDLANRTTSIRHVTDDGSPICYFDYTYRADGQVMRLDREDGSHVYYQYDHNNRLAAQDWYSGGACIYAFAYDYDAAGNRTYDSLNGVETYYEYSPADELLRKHVLPADEWAYYAYDANGSLVRLHKPSAGECTYFAYNDIPLVESIRYPDGSMNYFHYDGQMRRYAVEDSTGVHYFYHDGLNPLSKVSAADEVVASYANGPSRVPGNGTLIGIKQDAVSIPCFDVVGTLFAAVDADAVSVLGREWDAFGRNLGKTGALDTDFGYQTNWRELRDWPETDKWHLSPTRLEAPEEGRFTQRDMIAQPQGANPYLLLPDSLTLAVGSSATSLYEFASSNPHGGADPTGLGTMILRFEIVTKVKPGKGFDLKRMCDKIRDILKPCWKPLKCDEVGIQCLIVARGAFSHSGFLKLAGRKFSYTQNITFSPGKTFAGYTNAGTPESSVFPRGVEAIIESSKFNQAYANCIVHEAIWRGLLGESGGWFAEPGTLPSVAGTTKPMKVTDVECSRIRKKLEVK